MERCNQCCKETLRKNNSLNSNQMKIKNLFCIITILFSGACFANTKSFVVISGVTHNNTNLYISIFNSEQSYKKREPFFSKQIIANSNIVKVEIDLPQGEYLFSVFQDLNKNGKCDSNIIGIPKEPVGISKYDGKGAPGNFQKHKVLIGPDSNKVSIDLHRL